MKFGVLGINYKLADLKLRESLAHCCQRRFSADHSTHGGNHHFVLLSTCNRTEIYFFSENLAETHTYILNILRYEVAEEFDQKLYSYFGSDCFLHLCRVVTGLDSAIVGETEIQGQVKVSYEYAANYIALPEQLHYLFQKALKVGKQVRSQLPMQRGLPDLEHAILNIGIQTFADIQNVNILFVGASEINRKIISFFKNRKFQKLTLCNRSSQVASDLVNLHGIGILEWHNISKWHHFDWVIFGTKANGYLVGQQPIPFSNCVGRKLIIDLSVPRNVNPDIVKESGVTLLNKESGVTLLNIDEINQTLSIRHQQMAHIISQAEDLIGHYTRRQMGLRSSSESRRMLYELSNSSVGA